MSNFDEEFEPIPERVTKLKTASTVARERALQKAGLDANWYTTKVDELRNSNGEPCCESCGQPEKKKLPNGRLKDLVVDTKAKKLVCQRCADKNYRLQQKINVSKRNDREGADTGDAFWTRNRNKLLSESEKVHFEGRDEEITLLVEEMESVLRAAKAGRKFDESALRDFIREVCVEVLEHGTVDVDLVLADFFKPERKELYDDIVSKGGANAIFVQFGHYQAIPCVSPNSVVSRFLEFAESRYALPNAIYESYATRMNRILDALNGKVYQQPLLHTRCATPGCKETKVYDFSDPANWYCTTCEVERNKKGLAARNRIYDQHLTEARNDSTTDKWGRPKPQFGRRDWVKEKIFGPKSEPDRNTVLGEDGEFNG